MKFLAFLFWIPALIVLRLSIHQEIQAERDRAAAHEKPRVAAHSAHLRQLLDPKTVARDARVSAFNFLALRLGSAMRATGGVNTFFGKHEAFYRPTVHDVRFDNLLDIRDGNAAIPDAVRINHDCRPVFALIETARHIRAHSFLEPTQSEFLLKEELELGLARGIAATARMSRVALIAADEKMLLELGHILNLQDFGQRGGKLRALGARLVE